MRFALPMLIALFLVNHSTLESMAALPVPPCADVDQAVPGFAALDQQPTILLETDKARINEWMPPACLGWSVQPADIVVALAARTRADSIENFLVRLARVSSLEDVRYWSITRQSWRRLLDSASALSAPDRTALRADFAIDEFTVGTPLYAVHDDNDPMGPVVHRMEIRELSGERLVIATKNVGPGRVFGIEVLQPGGLENVTIIERESGDTWRYYAITRLRARIPGWLLPPNAAYINRVAAFYRYMTGLPTASEPPPVPREEDAPG